MKNILLVIFCLYISALTMPLQAQNSAIIIETQSHSVFKGFFQSVWVRLKSLNPSMKESANSKVVYTAGVRGAESTDTLLKPYWKGDLTRIKSFRPNCRSSAWRNSRWTVVNSNRRLIPMTVFSTNMP